MKYRPDVDGLRAIAILFVLIFHSGLTLIPSGFVGVDIFFVISGFLITRIIYQSLQNNSFSFLQFYGHRLWRLQPLFICLIVTTMVVTLLFYLPDDLLQYFKSARKTSLFVSNRFFERITSGYFAPDTHQLPLLHTWSLSIEWQCYLILPLVIYLLQRVFSKKSMLGITYLCMLIFFFISLYLSSRFPEKSYYQFTSRIFEFLIGSCVALTPKRTTANKYILNGLSLLALFAIVYIATRSEISLGFPNGYAFALCLATAVIIAVGEYEPKTALTKLLSLKPVVFIGLLSYSLYIWHWPLFALMHYQSIETTYSTLALAFSLIFILSYLSWRYIEKPARKFNNSKFIYTAIYLLALPIGVTYLANHYVKKYKGYPERFNPEVVRIYKQLDRYNSPQRALCLQRKNTEINTQCTLGAKNANSQTGLMIGDSFSNHAWVFMDTLAQQANITILAHATASCLALPGIYQYDWYEKNAIYQECYAQTTRYFNMIKTNHYDYVILGEAWKGYLGDKIINNLNDDRSLELSKKRMAAALDNALQIIINSGAKPVLIKPTAVAKQNMHTCFFKHIKRRADYDPKACNFTLQTTEVQSEEDWVNNLFLVMKNKYPQLIIIDPKKIQCPNGQCTAEIKGVPAFRDEGHITDYASYQLAKRYLQEYGNPLKA
ncbi:acyltransferase family protein [Legionella saoudiensis]|uniref:acyltransferase family protein n=1 Tax=Legionella saoudiensis TaxID=1750561 RepID=UPI0007301489|nr:acyltransferase family protein [Legionella saoudiensis]